MINGTLKGITGEGFSIYRSYNQVELMCLIMIHKGAFWDFIPASWEIAA